MRRKDCCPHRLQAIKGRRVVGAADRPQDERKSAQPDLFRHRGKRFSRATDDTEAIGLEMLAQESAGIVIERRCCAPQVHRRLGKPRRRQTMLRQRRHQRPHAHAIEARIGIARIGDDWQPALGRNFRQRIARHMKQRPRENDAVDRLSSAMAARP